MSGQPKSPLGIFWDIENCAVPKNANASDVAKRIRQHIQTVHPECGYAKEFFIAGDIRRMDAHVCESLDRNGVVVVHVNSTAKNAADDKLKELIDMFVDKFGSDSVLVVITGDINFATPIRGARRKEIAVVLIHGTSHSRDLKNLVDESYLFEDVIKGCETITKEEKQLNPAYLKVSNLPKEGSIAPIVNRLSHLSANCGGKVEGVVSGEGVIRFGCKDDAQRALQRMAGEDCLGRKIDVKLMDSAPKTPTKGSHPTDAKPNTTDSKDSCKSVIKGLVTRSDQNITEMVRKIVNDWNDSSVTGNSIVCVETNSRQRVDGNQKSVNLFVTAINPKASQALVMAAKRHIKAEHKIIWIKYTPRDVSRSSEAVSTHDSDDTGSEMSFYSTVSSMKNSPQNEKVLQNKTNINEERKSIIKGLSFTSDDKVIKLVRMLVNEWKDNQINGNLIANVEKMDDKALLVTAVSPEANQTLLSAAKQHLPPEKGIHWKPFTKNRKQNKQNVTKPEAKARKDSKEGKAENKGNCEDDCKSVIKGLFTKKDENVTQLVRKLVKDWNDSQINPNIITFVNRGGKDDGKVTLFVTTTTAQNNHLLFTAAKKHLKEKDGIKWFKFIQKPQTNQNEAKAEAKSQPNSPQFEENSCKSVLKGMETKKDDNVLRIVRELVKSWSDTTLNSTLIADVKRDKKFTQRDGKALLFVMAVNPESSIALVNAGNRHLKDGLQWSHYKPKARKDSEVDTESNASDLDRNLLTKSSNDDNHSLATPVSNDCLSVIIGLEIKKDQNMSKIVRKLVMDWKDSKIQGNFITRVENFPGFDNVGGDGCPPLLVVASSAQNCELLIAGAQRYLNGDKIRWNRYSA